MIPVRAEELTPEFFEESLKSKLGSDVRVVCCDVRPASAVKMGFLATHLKATVVVADRKSTKRLLSLFIKLVPLEDGFFMDFLVKERFDVREVKFFEDVATAVARYLEPKCDWVLPIPRLAFSMDTTEEPRSILVLHDATEDGFRARSLGLGWDLPHLLAGVRSLAKFHASSVSYMLAHGLDVQAVERKFPVLRFNPLGFTGTLEFRRACVDNLLADMAAHDEGRAGDEDEDAVRAELESVKSWDVDYVTGRYRRGLEGPFVGLAHRDCWNNNFMFRYDSATGEPVDAMLCDWQWAGVYNVTADLASLLYTSVEADLRARCMGYVLREYFRAFTHVLESLGTKLDVDFDAFELSFYDVGVHAAFDLMRVLRIPFSKSDAEFEGSPIMRRMTAAFREMMRSRIEKRLW